MKKQCIKTFKQTYKKDGIERGFSYQVCVVRDTDGYVYRIMNMDEMSIWKSYRFKTFKEAENFLNKHPHNIENQKERINK